MKKHRLMATAAVTLVMTGALTACAPHSTNPTANANAAVPRPTMLVDTKHPGETGTASLLSTDAEPVVYGLRKFPYPYKAMLALSSDADSETLRKFNLLHQFINTTEMTPMGRGLGLDFADSFFMYNGDNQKGYVDIKHEPMSDQMTWFRGVSNQPYAASIINHYIHTGWIDTIHTYGDFSETDQTKTMFQRKLAKQGIDALQANGDVITVWTDHGNKSNVDNFGSYGDAQFYSYQQGANPWSKYYHTNWTLPYGVKFVWTDIASDQFGVKSTLFPVILPDHRHVWGFTRYTCQSFNSQGDPQWNWTVYHLADQLTPAHLKTLEADHAYSIVAQHLNGTLFPVPLNASAVGALRLLSNEYHAGRILVAGTARLLQYNVSQQYVYYNVSHVGRTAVIHIRDINDPVFGVHVPSINEIRGLTFYTSNPSRTILEIGNTPIAKDMVQYNDNDGVHPSIAVKWYTINTTDYAEKQPGVL